MSEIEQSSPPPGSLKRETLELFAPLPRHYDRVAAVLSFGQDPRWRRAMVEAVRAEGGERVLDVATGTGLVAQELVRRYGCEVVGLDQSPQMLAGAQARLNGDRELAERVSLVHGEAEQLPFADEQFDHLTFTYLLRYVEDPQATMAELARVVKPGGRIASLEFAVPPRALWRGLWSFYTHVGLPLLGRAVSREWAHTGHFLSESIPTFYERYPMARVVELWERAGVVGRARSPHELGRRCRDVGHEARTGACHGRHRRRQRCCDAGQRRGRSSNGGLWKDKRRWRLQAGLSGRRSTRCAPAAGAIY